MATKYIAAVVIAAAAAFTTSTASAQSFDCGPYLSRRQAPESVICSTPQLQSLDEEMASLYDSIIDRLPSRAAERLRQNQRQWLASRDSCGFDANCLVGHYRRRISALNSY